jgi:Asp-tRNA(Asn)/Glu-tRNA(Gln) amidotransferase A subunit family amidase
MRLKLGIATRLRAIDYVCAKRLRAKISRDFDELLHHVDAIVTPSAACTAPQIYKDALSTGEFNWTLFEEIMRFVTPANLTGLPAISFPADYDKGGLPIGFLAVGRAWEEHLLLKLAAVAEKFVQRKKPMVHYQLLP